MIIGASDTGKSTLARYLFQELSARGLVVAYLDADVGQSTLGLPTTMSLAVSSRAGDARFPPARRPISYFVGATTPRGCMLPTLVGAFRLQQRAEEMGADVVIVDTTGLVDSAQGGQALKQWKIELLAPPTVIALQRGRELEPIIWPLRRDARVRCIEVPVSPDAVARSRDVRMARRRARLAGYFDGARKCAFSVRQVAVYGIESMAFGALMAFQDEEGYCLGLGVVERASPDEENTIVRTPLRSLDCVASVRFGSVRWDLRAGQEL